MRISRHLAINAIIVFPVLVTALTLTDSAYALDPPAAVDGIVVDSFTTNSITATLTPPAGGGNVTDYYILYSPPCGIGAPLTTIGLIDACRFGGGDATTITVTDLVPSTSYGLYPIAYNTAGYGPTMLSAWQTTAAASAPGKPTGLNATKPTATTMDLAWAKPASDGGSPITKYSIQYKEEGTSGDWATIKTQSNDTKSTIPNLTPSTSYAFQAAAVNSVDTGLYSDQVVKSTSSAGPPYAPKWKSYESTTCDSISLGWTAPNNNGSKIIGYKIQYKNSTSTGPWTEIVTGSNGTSYTITDLIAYTLHFLQVAAGNDYNANNVTDWGSWSTPILAATLAASTPGAPTELGAFNATTKTVELTWTAPSDRGCPELNAYKIQYRTTTFDNTATPSTWRDAGIVPGIATSSTVTGLKSSTSYDFQVAAVNSAGTGPYSDTATRPTTPGGVTLITHARYTDVFAAWHPPNPGGDPDGAVNATGYVLQHKLSSANDWTVFDKYTLTDAHRNATITGLTPNQTSYDLRLAAKNDGGIGPFNPQSILTWFQTEPGPPRNLVAGNSTYDSVELNWDVPAIIGGSNVTRYTVEYRLDDSHAWLPRNVTGKPVPTEYTVTDLVANATYNFKVSATNHIGTGQPSSTIKNATALPSVPGAPPEIRAANATATTVDLAWTAPDYKGSKITGYTIRVSNSTAWADIPTGSNKTVHTVTDLNPYTEYAFKTNATNSVGTGSASPETRATTLTGIPDKPAGLNATNITKDSVSLAWAAPPGNGATVIDYNVQYKNTASDWQTHPRPKSNTPSETVAGLSANTSYDFQVRAVTSISPGPWSDKITNSTLADKPQPPTGLNATNITKDSVSLAWAAPTDTGGSDITNYNVQYKNTTANDWINHNRTTTVLTTPSESVTGLVRATLYDFRVAALNSINKTSYWSDSITNSTLSTVPDAPRSVSTGNVTQTSMIVNWEAPTDDGGSTIDTYKVRHAPPISGLAGNWTEHRTGNANLSYTIGRLTLDTTYDIQARACNSNGCGYWSETKSQATLGTAPNKPESLGMVSGSSGYFYGLWGAIRNSGMSSWVELLWTEPTNSTVTDYVVQYRPLWKYIDDHNFIRIGHNSTWVVFDDGISNATSAIVSNITNSTNKPQAMEFRVAAKNEVGTSGYSTHLYARTDARSYCAPELERLTVTSVNSTSASFEWSQPSDPVCSGGDNPHTRSGYYLKGFTEPNERYSHSTTSATLTGLDPGTTYRFELLDSGSITSTISNEVILKTPPNTPVNVQRSNSTSTTLILGWNNTGSSYNDYAVQYKPTSSDIWIANDSYLTHCPSSSQCDPRMIFNLEPNTPYHVRAAGVGSFGPHYIFPADGGTYSYTSPSGNFWHETSYSPWSETVTLRTNSTSSTGTAITSASNW